jgi:release factor glutamine methyltransferase
MRFCGVDVRIDPGVYVPRWHSKQLASRAVARLPYAGTAVDLCTGSGAIAKVMSSALPEARVVACDLDERAVACARANGIEAYHGDLFEPLPADLRGLVDVVVAVVPYVPADELRLLQRDTFTFESTLAYDGGSHGTDVLRRVIAGAPRVLRPGGALLLELGGHQAELLRDDLARCGYEEPEVLLDDDGDVRGVEALAARPHRLAQSSSGASADSKLSPSSVSR